MRTPAIQAELITLLRKADDWTSTERLAELTGRSHTYIARQAAELHEAGRVDRHGGGGRGSYRWRISAD